MQLLGPDKRFTTTVIAEGDIAGDTLHGNLILHGGGDANFAGPHTLPYSSKNKPPANPLADIDDLAQQIAAKGLHTIDGDLIGDDTAYEHTPYPEGWSTDDMLWGYGAPTSALTIHDNLIDITLHPGPLYKPATGDFSPNLTYYRVNPPVPGQLWKPHVLTTDNKNASSSLLRIYRDPGSLDLTIFGDISSAERTHEAISIEDPAMYAALALRASLARLGVTVTGSVRVQHRQDGDLMPFLEHVQKNQYYPKPILDKIFQPSKVECEVQAIDTGPEPTRTKLAEHISPPLQDDLVLTNKLSENLHAEIMLRNISAEKLCSSSLAGSAQLVHAYLTTKVGLDPTDFIFYDGSGLSTKDLVTPRATAKLLAYAATQPWFPQWRAALPIGGVDGTLADRFKEPPLKGHVFAKTGTLGESRALAGYLDAASGQTLIFAIYVDNHTPGSSADRAVMDKIVAAIAAAN